MHIPFVDLKSQYREIENEIKEAAARVFQHGIFVQGPDVTEFENTFAEYLGVKHGIGVGSGTDALYIALKCLGIGKGDEVITAANSFIATSEAISMTEAEVVFADYNTETYNIDLNDLASKVSKRTKAVVPVHIYGQPVDMEKLSAFAKEHHLFIVEDAAQAHGASFKNKKVGTFGHAGCFSFYPSKNLGAYGDGGAIVTNDDQLAKKCRMFADHGRKTKYDHQIEGCNSKLDSLQAAFLNVKLKYLEGWTERRISSASFYNNTLKEIVATPKVISGARHVYHLYVVRMKNRDQVRKQLSEKGIDTGIHYPVPLPLLEAYSNFGYEPSDFPIASSLKDEILSLPMHEHLTEEQIEYVADQIKIFIQ